MKKPALTYTAGGRLAITTRTDLNNSIMIEISDTRVGITKEDITKIFDPFYTKDKHKGTGL